MHIQHSLGAVLSAWKKRSLGVGGLGDSLISLYQDSPLQKNKNKTQDKKKKKRIHCKTTVTSHTTHFDHPVLHLEECIAVHW